MDMNGYDFDVDKGLDHFIASALVRLKSLGWTMDECVQHSPRILRIINDVQDQLTQRVARSVGGATSSGELSSDKWLCLVNANFAHEGFVFANVYHETMRMIEAAPNN
jgi:hypothetical protein